MKKFLFLILLVAAASGALADSKQLLYGRLLGSNDAGTLIACDPAKHSHPTGFFGIADSRERVVFVAGNPAIIRKLGQIGALWINPVPKKDDIVAIVAYEAGEYTYTTVTGAKNTVANFVRAEQVPTYSVVTPLDPAKTETKVAEARGTTQTPDLTLRRSW